MRRIVISQEVYHKTGMTAEHIWRGLKTIHQIFVFLWFGIVSLMAFGVISYSSSTVLITIIILFNTIFVLNVIYLTDFKPVYGGINSMACLFYTYLVIPIIASWSEDKFGMAYLFGIELADIWHVYGSVLELTLMITILGAIAKVSNFKQLTQRQNVI